MFFLILIFSSGIKNIKKNHTLGEDFFFLLENLYIHSVQASMLLKLSTTITSYDENIVIYINLPAQI